MLQEDPPDNRLSGPASLKTSLKPRVVDVLSGKDRDRLDALINAKDRPAPKLSHKVKERRGLDLATQQRTGLLQEPNLQTLPIKQTSPSRNGPTPQKNQRRPN